MEHWCILFFSLVKDNAGVSFFGRNHVFQHGMDRNDAAAGAKVAEKFANKNTTFLNSSFTQSYRGR